MIAQGHGHYDHTGGLPAVLEAIGAPGGRVRLAQAFGERFFFNGTSLRFPLQPASP